MSDAAASFDEAVLGLAPVLPQAAPGPPPLATPEAEARAFWRMRGRLVSTMLEQTLARARFRVSLVAVLSALLWLALFFLFADGFVFLDSAITDAAMHQSMVELVFGMFFIAMSVMLVFSSGIILYGSLFRSPDATMLLTMPARTERIFVHKLQEAILLSSWAFVLLGSPMLLAYGIVSKAPWYYYALLPPFLIGFTYIPAGIGGILCLLVVRFLPRGRLLVLLSAVALAIGLGVAAVWSVTARADNEMLTYGWLQEMLGRLRLSQHRLLPSWWLSTGILQAEAAQPAESVKFLVLTISNALFFRMLATWTAGTLYRRAYNRLFIGAGTGLRALDRILVGFDRILAIFAGSFDKLVAGSTRILPRPARLLILKDVRLFRRDPVQWSQFLIFFGLLLLYFLNIRRYGYGANYAGWVNMVSFLNVSVVGLLLSTFTTRFIFPMISLEGRRFWVLGLLPVRRETILWSKFFFAAGGSIVPCSCLIAISDAMLGVAPLIFVSHQLTCLILCVGLSGIAVGLGAKMPNLHEQSPSRIAAGFGGTLNLVLSTLYIVAVVLLTALPSHFYLGLTAQSFDLRNVAILPSWLQWWLFAGTAGSVLLGVLATVLPLRMGFAAFRRLEF